MAAFISIGVLLAGCGGLASSSVHDPDWPNGTGSAAANVSAVAPHPELGPFAGFIWHGDVHSVHADWTVPRLLPGSARGEAATWIGAEAPGPTRGAAFIQVGVNEGNTGGMPFSYAFYSSTTLHFHPVRLFDVVGGDHVSATLSRRGARWQITFVDLMGRERRLSVAEGAGQQFNEAQYTQEDVTDARTGRPFPYPSLSPIRFTAVAVNGEVPRTSRLTTSWLTEAGGYLAPAPLRGGAFELTQTQMSVAGWHYLHAVAAQDAASTDTTKLLLRWEQGGPTRLAAYAVRHFADYVRATVRTLNAAAGWQAARRPAVSALRAHSRRLIALVSTIRNATRAGRFAWAEQFGWLAQVVSADGQRARRALQLPSLMVPRTK